MRNVSGMPPLKVNPPTMFELQCFLPITTINSTSIYVDEIMETVHRLPVYLYPDTLG